MTSACFHRYFLNAFDNEDRLKVRLGISTLRLFCNSSNPKSLGLSMLRLQHFAILSALYVPNCLVVLTILNLRRKIRRSRVITSLVGVFCISPCSQFNFVHILFYVHALFFICRRKTTTDSNYAVFTFA